MHARTLVAGTAVGAAAMYWLDPQAGRRRRARARQRAVHLTHEAEHAARVLTRELTHRSEGLRGAFGRWLRPRQVWDDVLKERVRARLGRFCSHPHAIQVECRDGHVALRGPILAGERSRVLKGIDHVSGVKSVMDGLGPVRETGHVSALQGGRARPGATVDVLQSTWAPTTRALAALSGALFLARGRRRRNLVAGLACGAAGVALLARAAGTRGRARYTTLGGRMAVTVQKTIHLGASVKKVFALWSKLEVFPRFMTHVRAVRRDDKHSHWKVTGPLGTAVEWGPEVTDLQPNRLIAWRSVEGSDIQHAGTITFARCGDGKTDVQVQLSYHPPGGIVGHALATLFGVAPKQQLDDALLRLKSLLETGKATGLGESLRREELV